MRKIVSGIAAFTFAAASATVGFAATGSGMTAPMPKCMSGPVVWQANGSKAYVAKGHPGYGKGKGKYVCRGVVTGPVKPMGGSNAMGGANSSGGRNASGTMRPSTGNAAPGSTSTAPPASTMGGASGNQGNTGAPGAGGQVPNNPASTSNSSPNPRPSTQP